MLRPLCLALLAGLVSSSPLPTFHMLGPHKTSNKLSNLELLIPIEVDTNLKKLNYDRNLSPEYRAHFDVLQEPYSRIPSEEFVLGDSFPLAEVLNPAETAKKDLSRLQRPLSVADHLAKKLAKLFAGAEGQEWLTDDLGATCRQYLQLNNAANNYRRVNVFVKQLPHYEVIVHLCLEYIQEQSTRVTHGSSEFQQLDAKSTDFGRNDLITYLIKTAPSDVHSSNVRLEGSGRPMKNYPWTWDSLKHIGSTDSFSENMITDRSDEYTDTIVVSSKGAQAGHLVEGTPVEVLGQSENHGGGCSVPRDAYSTVPGCHHYTCSSGIDKNLQANILPVFEHSHKNVYNDVATPNEPEHRVREEQDSTENTIGDSKESKASEEEESDERGSKKARSSAEEMDERYLPCLVDSLSAHAQPADTLAIINNYRLFTASGGRAGRSPCCQRCVGLVLLSRGGADHAFPPLAKFGPASGRRQWLAANSPEANR